MKTKWIDFIKAGKSKSGKTQIWDVCASNGSELGQIKWFGRWRRYAFYPYAFSIYEQDCLRLLADFCEEKSKKQRQKWKKGATNVKRT